MTGIPQTPDRSGIGNPVISNLSSASAGMVYAALSNPGRWRPVRQHGPLACADRLCRARQPDRQGIETDVFGPGLGGDHRRDTPHGTGPGIQLTRQAGRGILVAGLCRFHPSVLQEPFGRRSGVWWARLRLHPTVQGDRVCNRPSGSNHAMALWNRPHDGVSVPGRAGVYRGGSRPGGPRGERWAFRP